MAGGGQRAGDAKGQSQVSGLASSVAVMPVTNVWAPGQGQG
jgi:hypothetical protein